VIVESRNLKVWELAMYLRVELRFSVLLVCALLVLLGCSDVDRLSESSNAVTGDSLVLVKDQPGYLAYDQLVPGTVVVRNTYLPDKPKTYVYQEGRDYLVDYEQGTIMRTAGSRIADFSRNVLYGKKKFNHSDYPQYGNHDFFVWVDYQTRDTVPLAEPRSQAEFLTKSDAKLRGGGYFKIIAFGDSITVGGEASESDLQFPRLYVRHLLDNFPKASIALENGATGGDTTVNGLERLEEKVLTRQPDLVLIGFGMNDHVVGITTDQFYDNLTKIVQEIRSRTGADMILFSHFAPNPDWHYSNDSVGEYTEVIRKVARENECAYADVYGIWQKVLERKDFSSLLGNNINHPNDFGHWLYFLALKSIYP
jgi:acyl-CoA thioesterase I